MSENIWYQTRRTALGIPIYVPRPGALRLVSPYMYPDQAHSRRSFWYIGWLLELHQPQALHYTLLPDLATWISFNPALMLSSSLLSERRVCRLESHQKYLLCVQKTYHKKGFWARWYVLRTIYVNMYQCVNNKYWYEKKSFPKPNFISYNSW